MKCTVLNLICFIKLIVEDDLEVGFDLIPFILEPDSFETVRNQTFLQDKLRTVGMGRRRWRGHIMLKVCLMD